jgi:hypothetical protein
MSDAYESQVDGRMHLAQHALEKVIERDISPAELAEALSRLNQIYLQGGCRSHPIGKVRRGTGLQLSTETLLARLDRALAAVCDSNHRSGNGHRSRLGPT